MTKLSLWFNSPLWASAFSLLRLHLLRNLNRIPLYDWSAWCKDLYL